MPSRRRTIHLPAALFDIDHVTNVFYVDRWITITQDGGADWQDLAREVADPIRAAPAADAQSAATVAAATSCDCRFKSGGPAAPRYNQ